MKLVISRRSNGTPIPRVINPLVFVGTAIVLAFAVAAMTVMALLCLAYAPISWLSVVKVES